MNTIFWLIFLFILARRIWRFLERAGSNGKFEGPLGSPPTGMDGPGPGSEGKPKLQIPEYLTRQSEQPVELTTGRKDRAEPAMDYVEPVVLAGDLNEPRFKRKPERPDFEDSLVVVGGTALGAIQEKKRSTVQKRDSLIQQEDLFSDMLHPEQVVKGIAWSQILGPRGGRKPIGLNSFNQHGIL